MTAVTPQQVGRETSLLPPHTSSMTGSYGTCYSATECEALGGSSLGLCASGFGVCCTFSGGCGGTTAINNTYFTGSDSGTSPCQFSVCKVSSDVCQIRLNFDTFEISQPSTAVLPTANTASLAGQRTQCLEAQFRLVFVVEKRLRDFCSVTAPGPAPPLICGSNKGHHMIVGWYSNSHPQA